MSSATSEGWTNPSTNSLETVEKMACMESGREMAIVPNPCAARTLNSFPRD